MSSKECALFNALAASLSQPCRHVESLALLVHSTLVANGFIPVNIQPGSVPGQIEVIPPDWPRATPELFTFTYVGNVELKCVPVGSSRLAVHATDERGKIFSVNLDFEATATQLNPEAVIKFVKANLLNVLEGKKDNHHPPSSVDEDRSRRIIVETQAPSSGYAPPRAPLFGTPIGPGELVGPEHPIFTGDGQTGEGRQRGVRDPRFDPIGPGYIGEPDTDHFPPPPFGDPPGGRRPPGRAPLRGPHANMGPGNMFM